MNWPAERDFDAKDERVSTHEVEVMVANKHGLHARPVTLFVQLANKYESDVQVSDGNLTVDGKSAMSLLRLGVGRGTMLKIRVKGKDSAEVIQKLAQLVNDKFGEE